MYRILFAFGILAALFSGLIFSGCAKKAEVEAKEGKCYVNKYFASVSFEVSGDMAELVEKSAKKALLNSCFKKSETSNTNLRIKIDSKQTLITESGFIKDKLDNSLNINIAAIVMIPTSEGGLTTLTSKQNATLNLKSTPIASIGNKAELSEKEVAPFVESNTTKALNNLFNDIP